MNRQQYEINAKNLKGYGDFDPKRLPFFNVIPKKVSNNGDLT